VDFSNLLWSKTGCLLSRVGKGSNFFSDKASFQSFSRKNIMSFTSDFKKRLNGPKKATSLWKPTGMNANSGSSG
jgi:hypothetical protein